MKHVEELVKTIRDAADAILACQPERGIEPKEEMPERIKSMKEWLLGFSHPVRKRVLFRRFSDYQSKRAYTFAVKQGELIEQGDGRKGSPLTVLVADAYPTLPPYVLAVPYSAWSAFALRVVSRNGDPAKELTDYLNR